jgi:cytidylate kinase
MSPRSSGAGTGVAVVSDVHASEAEPGSAAAFAGFLRSGALDGASRLVLLGDLFDAWFGARMARVPFYRGVLEAIAAVARRGVAVTFVAGNRDFLFDASVARPFGIEVFPGDELPVDPFARRALLLHGDTLCTEDAAYQRLRRVVRSAPARFLARTLPHGALHRIARSLRRRSVAAVEAKPPRVLEISRDAAASALRRHGARDLVCGHVHEAAVRAIGVDGGASMLYTLGSWSERGGTYAMLGPTGPRLVRHVAAPGASALEPGGSDAPRSSISGPSRARRIVTLDGPAGSGKSTIARDLARRLGWRYLDSGALYRAVTHRVLRDGVPLDDDDAVAEAVRRLRVEMSDGRSVRIDGEDVSSRLRDPDVTRNVSRVAEIPAVREMLLPVQRQQALEGDLVAEGRDMGSVVFPEADRKFFLDASLEERAERRRKELSARGENEPIDRVIEDVRRRDEWDSTRRTAPLRRGDDFITVDTTNLSRERVIEILLDLVRD